MASAVSFAGDAANGTGGDTLWCPVGNTVQKGEDSVFIATNGVAAIGNYLDTLVQFTPTEGEETRQLDSNDKLAVWLKVDSGTTPATTNLMVRARGWKLDGGRPVSSVTSFAVDNVSVEVEKWYRLTIRAVQTVVNPESGTIIPAFQIFIDGNAVTAAEPQFAADLQKKFSDGGIWCEDMGDLASANKLFPSLIKAPRSLEENRIQAVGFNGSGAFDDIAWTEYDPLQSTGIEFTLTWPTTIPCFIGD